MTDELTVMEVVVRPVRNAAGTYVLKEFTFYDQMVPGWRSVHRQRRCIWPETKQANGRGKIFATQREALQFYEDHRDKDIPLMGLQRMMLKNAKII